MASDLNILLGTAAALGFIHTLFGPDHYLPFIVMSKARNWSLKKTSLITVLCGIGHVLGSILLGAIGIAAGIAVTSLEGVEGTRGDIAAWSLIAFGFVYFAWGLKRAWKNQPHTHAHAHMDGSVHEHDHVHMKEHTHVHEDGQELHLDGDSCISKSSKKAEAKKMTPWVLFVIFVLGPCEPLIPILMYPAAQSSAWGVAMVALVFGLVTILTMTGMVLLALAGISFLPMEKVERFTHAIAGGTIAASGMAIVFLGL